MGSLDDYFTPEKTTGYTYTDHDCQNISRHLRAKNYLNWAETPSIYILLRLIGRLDVMDDFIEMQQKDICLPFRRTSSLPQRLRSCADKFFERQTCVLTEAVILESGLPDERRVHLFLDAFPYQSAGRLGSGRYMVDRVRSPLSKELYYARKRFPRLSGLSIREEFENELRNLKKIDHDHCIHFVASYTDKQYFGLLMSPVADCNFTEFMSRTEHLRQADNHFGNVNLLGEFFGCLAAAVDYLHQNRIRHRDIKPDNILVKGHRVYLTDFGISLNWQLLSRSTTTEESGKTYNYCAPEVAEPKQKRNSKADIWSLGCVFTEMLVVRKGRNMDELKTAFHHSSETKAYHKNVAIAHQWLENQLEEPRPLGIGRSVSELTKEMLSIAPNERPDASEVHHVLSSFQSSNESLINPYCGQCCVTEPLDDIWKERRPEDLQGEFATFEDSHALLSPYTPVKSPSPSDNSQANTLPLPADLSIRRKPVTASSSPPRSSMPLDSSSSGPSKFVHSGALGSPQTPGPRSPPEQTYSEYPHGSALQIPPNSGGVYSSPVRGDMLKSIPFVPCPYVDLKGKLPDIKAYHWKEPATLVGEIRQFFRRSGNRVLIPKSVFTRIDTLREGIDLIPILHLLLLNGLSIKKMRREAGRDPTPIAAVILDKVDGGRSTWQSSGIQLSVVRLLIAFAGLNGERYCGDGLLTTTILLDRMDLLKVFLDAGADPDTDDVSKTAMVVLAAKLGRVKALKRLDAAGARHDPLPRGNDLATPLFIAAEKGHLDCVAYLTQHPAYARLLEIGSFRSDTPLSVAAVKGHASVVKLLLTVGANPRAIYSSESSGYLMEPLVGAARAGNLPVVRVLVEVAGVNPDAPPPDGVRALAFRRVRQNKAISSYLREKGALEVKFFEKIHFE